MRKIIIIGDHRVGKSHLMKLIAEHHNLPYVEVPLREEPPRLVIKPEPLTAFDHRQHHNESLTKFLKKRKK